MCDVGAKEEERGIIYITRIIKRKRERHQKIKMSERRESTNVTNDKWETFVVFSSSTFIERLLLPGWMIYHGSSMIVK